jgi:hypothetical protein
LLFVADILKVCCWGCSWSSCTCTTNICYHGAISAIEIVCRCRWPIEDQGRRSRIPVSLESDQKKKNSESNRSTIHCQSRSRQNKNKRDLRASRASLELFPRPTRPRTEIVWGRASLVSPQAHCSFQFLAWLVLLIVAADGSKLPPHLRLHLLLSMSLSVSA